MSQTRRGAFRMDQDHPCHRTRLGLAAQAVTGRDAVLIDDRLRQAVGRGQQVLAVASSDQRTAEASARATCRTCRRPLRQRLQRVGTGNKRCRLVQRLEPRAGLQALGLFPDLPSIDSTAP